MTSKSPSATDRHVGSRVRMRRMLIGMSQEKLGKSLGLTFQQVQKYEKGTNRISVSRMIDIANVLGVDIDFFFEGLTGGKKASGSASPQPAFVSDFMATQEGHQLMRAFTRIANPKLRRAVVQLAGSLAEGGEEPKRGR
jgi:transcriptional regulator with XRE-family HTH domain